MRGRDIKRDGYEWAGLYVIFIPWHFPLQDDISISGASVKAERIFSKQYTALYNHLLKYKEKLIKRNKAETGIRYEWYALQRWGAKYSDDFDKQKIIYGQFRKGEFCLDDNRMLLSSNEYFIVSDKHRLKSLLVFLNSDICYFYQKMIMNSLSGNTTIAQKSLFIKLPVPQIDSKDAKLIDFYELFGFTDEEINFISSSVNSNEE